MAILKKKDQPRQKAQIDLTGPDGNAYVLLGYCRNLARQIGMDWEPIQQDATSSDYEHLVDTLQKHFGDYVDFIR